MTASVGSPAGFWKRYVAYFIDVLMLYLATELLSALFFSSIGSSELQQVSALMNAMMDQQALTQDPQALLAQVETLLWQTLLFSGSTYVVLGAVYFTWMESSPQQATLGKRLIGIKVTDVLGRRIGRGRALARFFAASLSWLTLNLGHALAAWTPERRALHDYLAGTRVENVDPAQPQMPLWGWMVVAAHALIFLAITLGTVAAVWLALQTMSETM
jgi:uncharacterized RDD family membrane protein YckC